MSSFGILGKADYFAGGVRSTYVRITDDKSRAFLYLAPKEDGEKYSVDELLRLLVENGVVFGVNRSSVIAMCKKEVYDREIQVAQMLEPIEGKDGYYEYTFNENAGAKKPVIREDGSVDYQSMRAVNSVEEGSLLAIYHHAVPGRDGKNVCGQDLTVPAVREQLSIVGKGVYQAADDPDRIYAEKGGKIEISSGKLNIVNILEISDDVDQLTGTVEFYGDIHIMGNVEAGTVIRAGKSLTIDGTVEAADLYAGGDIILKRGIQGNQKAHIQSRGNLFADFIEHSFVKVEGAIEANYILSSYISAEGNIKLSGKKASLIGGNVYAKMGISCNSLGNAKGIKTRACAGISQEMFDDAEKFQKELKNIRSEIQKIRTAVSSLGNRITPELQESYKFQLQQQMADQKAVLDRQKALSDSMEAAKTAKIQVYEGIFVGAEICIDNNVLIIEKNNRSMEYRNVSGMITGRVIAV